ncbi:MAG TPA: hypothetical protein VJ761_24040 [Ktedonobacteraceae bacterium]|nr:hypothetical protein [Ktedonobacteraceae bacterium]
MFITRGTTSIELRFAAQLLLRGRSLFNRSSMLTVRVRPVSISLALSGGFNVRYTYRLALSRLAARLHFRLLFLIVAFFVFDWEKHTSLHNGCQA